MNWRELLNTSPSTHNSQNPHKNEHCFENSEDNEHRFLLNPNRRVIADVRAYYFERSSVMEYEGKVPPELASYVARLETLVWWLNKECPETAHEWAAVSATIR